MTWKDLSPSDVAILNKHSGAPARPVLQDNPVCQGAICKLVTLVIRVKSRLFFGQTSFVDDNATPDNLDLCQTRKEVSLEIFPYLVP